MPVFRDELVVAATFLHLRRTTDCLAFALLAYVFMPDHVHLLLQGLHPASDLRRCVRAFRQSAEGQFTRLAGRRLWQREYRGRTLRRDEATVTVARHLFENPVRRQLAATPTEYLYLGSDLGPVEHFFGEDGGGPP